MEQQRHYSFVGTAQYVSPEMVSREGERQHEGVDLWAVGCMAYQFITGRFPFYSMNACEGADSAIMQRIRRGEYTKPEDIEDFQPKCAIDFIQRLLEGDPDKRLGVDGGYEALKKHEFFDGVNWDSLPHQSPPEIDVFLFPSDIKWDEKKRGFEDIRAIEMDDTPTIDGSTASFASITTKITSEERDRRVAAQRQNNVFHRFTEDSLILKQGYLKKRVGYFARKRMFLLCDGADGPQLIYIKVDEKNPDKSIKKGVVPWKKSYFRVEGKSFSIFLIHTEKRIYYLISDELRATEWISSLNAVHQESFPNDVMNC